MKRRTFVIAACAAVVSVPILNYSWLYIHEPPIYYPEELGRICDENSIREIGKKYRSLFPAENLKQQLTELIMDGFSKEKMKTSDRSLIHKFLDQKIYEDFLGYKTFVIEGWVISITEARQCALYSFF